MQIILLMSCRYIYYADILGHIRMMWIFIVSSNVRYEMHI